MIQSFNVLGEGGADRFENGELGFCHSVTEVPAPFPVEFTEEVLGFTHAMTCGLFIKPNGDNLIGSQFFEGCGWGYLQFFASLKNGKQCPSIGGCVFIGFPDMVKFFLEFFQLIGKRIFLLLFLLEFVEKI